MIVQPIDHGETEPRADCKPAHQALDLIQQLIVESESAALELNRTLERLAAAFQVQGAGLAGVNCDRVAFQTCWSAQGVVLAEIGKRLHGWPEILARVWKSIPALPAITSNGESLLLAALRIDEDLGWVLWLEGGRDRHWDPGEQAALPLALATLARLLASSGSAVEATAWLERGRRQHGLERAAGVVGRLIHDFNNVLTGVLGFTELGLGQASPGSLAHQFLTEVYQAAQQGSRLANQLALFSRRAPARPRPTTLADLVAEEQARLQKQARDGLSLLVDLPPELTAVAMDPEPLRVILGQLIDNAREAMPSGGILAISARAMELSTGDCLSLLGTAQPGKHVELTVADTGTGFSPEARQRVLAEPFYTTKPRHRGLGLPAVYGILCVHGGGLRLEHDHRQGAVVKVYLRSSGAEAEPPEPVQDGEPPARGEKVLVIDDDPLTLQLMCTTLERAGYRVESAGDGLQALTSVHSAGEPFGLVVADVVMPHMTGFDLAERLLERDPRANLLFTSGHLPAGFRPDGLAGRQFDILQKPFRPEGLLRAVRSALDRQGLRSQYAATATENQKRS